MADNLHKLAIQIQGEIDNGFGRAINEMTLNLKQLDNEVKAIADSKMKPDAISAMYLNLNKESAEAAQELGKLNKQMKQADGYSKQSASVREAEERLKDARAEVERLEAAFKDSGTKEFAAALKAAKKEASSAESALNKENKTLSVMDDKLKDAGIDTRSLEKEQARLAGEIAKATEKSENFGKSLSKLTRAKFHFQEIRNHVKQLGSDLMWAGKAWMGMGAAAAGGAAALFKISDSMAAAGDAAAKAGAKLHMNAEAFQEMQYTANLSGVKDFGGMVQKFNASVARAAKDNKAAKILSDVGISARQLAKMGPEKAIMALSDELNKIKDPAKRGRAELALFGKSGAEMGAFLKLGSKEINALRGEARSIGLVISEETTKQAEAFNDARDKMYGSISGMKNIIGAELMPVFTETFHELSAFFVENQAVIKDFAKTLGVKFKEALPVIKSLAGGAGELSGKIWNVAKVVTNLVGGVENLGFIIAAMPLAKPIVTIGKLAWSFGSLIRTLWGVKGAIFAVGKVLLMNPIGIGIAAIVGGAVLIYKYWEPLKEFFTGLFGKVKSAALSAIAPIMKAWDGVPGWIKVALGPALGFITMPFKIAHKVIKTVIGYFRGYFKSVPEALKDAFSGILEIITEPFGKAFALVKDGWNTLKGLLGIGPEIEIPEPATARAPLRGRARGGMSSTPIVTKFAERGPEVAVPVGLADRGLGISNLKIAARALGVGGFGKPQGQPFLSGEPLDIGGLLKKLQGLLPLSAGGSPTPQGQPFLSGEPLRQGAKGESVKKPQQVFDMKFAPVINVTSREDDPRDIGRAVLDALRAEGPKMMSEWGEQVGRSAYATG